MSRLHSTRRLPLLAGSSIAIMAAVSALGASMLIMPAAALAADNPCGTNPNTNGSAPDSITCPPGSYPTGIEHTSNGDLSVTVGMGANTGLNVTGINLGTGGIVTTAGALNDDLAVSLAGTTTSPLSRMSTAFPVLLDTHSQAGDIQVQLDFVNTGTSSLNTLDLNNAATSHVIRAISDGAGNISVGVGGDLTAIRAISAGGYAGIEAESHGGDISVVAPTVNGRLYGILASTTGDGNITIQGSGAAGAAGTAGVDVTLETGLLTITGSAGIGSSAGSAIRATIGGDADINLVDATGLGTTNWVMDLTLSANSLANVQTSGTFAAGNSSNIAPRLMRVQGGGDVVFSGTGSIRGQLDFSGLTGSADFTIEDGGLWNTTAMSDLGPGEGTIMIASGGVLLASASRITNYNGDIDLVEDTITLDFGAGDDRLVNAGTLALGGPTSGSTPGTQPTEHLEYMLRLEGLEHFDNSGTILLGTYFKDLVALGTDRRHDDLIFMPGTTFTGSGASRIMFDVDLNGVGQTACDASLRAPVSFDMPAADCLGIQGGTTAGTTLVTINQAVPGDRGAYDPDGIVLIDVSGGTSAAEHFVLDPDSGDYSAANGGVIDKGFFVYSLAYDADEQQHKLVSLPGASALQFPVMANAAQSLWRLSGGTWFERQADLRGTIGEADSGAWLRASGENAERDLVQIVDAAGNPYSFDNNYKQTSYAITGGVDLIFVDTQESAFLLGVMAGYSHADIEFESSPNTGMFDGWTGGAYTSFVSGGLFVDAAVIGNRLVMDHDIPGLNLLPAGTILSTKLMSVGGQVEAGWRLPFGAAFVEPLASVSYVRTTADEFDIPADDASRQRISLEYDDPTSLRASLGARIGLDQEYGGFRVQYSALGRVWNEFEGENGVIFHSAGPDGRVVDEFTGQFTELGLGAGVYSGNGLVSGFINLGGRIGDDYRATTASGGVRVQW